MGFIPNSAQSSSSFTLRSSVDCQIINPANDQCLVYEGTLWRNKTLNIDKALDDLTDVEITDVQENQIIKFVGDQWINADMTLPSDIAVNSIATNIASFQTKTYNSIDQTFFIGGGTSLNPSYYNCDPTYESITIDASFITQNGSYVLKLPTTLPNESSIYIQVTALSGNLFSIMGGATIQDNI